MTDSGPAAAPGHRVAVALVADLLFASRIRGAATAAGLQVVLARSAAQLLEAAAHPAAVLVLVDLDARTGSVSEAIAQLKADARTQRIRVVAFGAHVQTEALQAARAAGADRVLARSAFVRELPQLLAATAGGGASGSTAP